MALASPRDGDCVWREFIARAELIVDLEGLPDGAWDAIRACDVCFDLAAASGGFAAPRQCVGVDDARDVLLGPAPPGPSALRVTLEQRGADGAGGGGVVAEAEPARVWIANGLRCAMGEGGAPPLHPFPLDPELARARRAAALAAPAASFLRVRWPAAGALLRSDVLVVALSLERAGPAGLGGAVERVRPEGLVEIVVTPLPFRGAEPAAPPPAAITLVSDDAHDFMEFPLPRELLHAAAALGGGDGAAHAARAAAAAALGADAADDALGSALARVGVEVRLTPPAGDANAPLAANPFDVYVLAARAAPPLPQLGLPCGGDDAANAAAALELCHPDAALAGWVLTAAALAARPGLLPSLPFVLVLAHWDEDVSWLARQPYPVLLYEKRPGRARDEAGAHGVAHNVGGESVAFLRFFADYYERLPRRALMLHSHRYACVCRARALSSDRLRTRAHKVSHGGRAHLATAPPARARQRRRGQ